MENELKDFVESVCHIPCFIDGESIIYPGATVRVYQDLPGNYGDGKGIGWTHSCEIAVYYNDRQQRDNAVMLLVDALNVLPGYTTPNCECIYDTTAKKYRATLSFERI